MEPFLGASMRSLQIDKPWKTSMFPSLFTIVWRLGAISIETPYSKIHKFI